MRDGGAVRLGDKMNWPIVSALTGFAIFVMIAWVNFIRPRIERSRARKRQEVVDRLSGLLSDAIGDLLNRSPPVDTDAALDEWRKDYDKWCDTVSGLIGEHFTRSEQLHFDRLGTLPKTAFAVAFDDKHNHLLTQLDIKFSRLRDIIRDNQIRE